MSDLKLIKTRVDAGVWEGHLTGHSDELPVLDVKHLDNALGELRVETDPEHDGQWRVHFDIPTQLISEGVQTFVIVSRDSGEALESFSIIAGEAVADDLRAEVNLLRAELDMLKSAFRRHCVETQA